MKLPLFWFHFIFFTMSHKNYFSIKNFILSALIAASFIGCKSSSSTTIENGGNNQEVTIEDELNGIMRNNSAVGLVVVAVKEGKIIYNKSLGYKDLETKSPIADNDIIRIASISKTFVATAILQLVESGKLSLDSDAAEIMGFKIRNPKYPDTPITIRMLLSHTSSMSDSNGYFTLDKLNPSASATWNKAWSDYTPGSKYQYCNLGYNTLGAIIEKVSGERFDQYIMNHILKPLNLYGSHNVHELDSNRFIKLYTFNSSNYSHVESKSAYQSIESELENYTMGYSTPLFSPTGGLKISPVDLAKAMMMHMNYGSLDGVKILDSATCSMMQSMITPTNYTNEYYGLGMITTDNLLKGHTLIGHDGLALGAYTAMYWSTDRKYGFVVATNGCSGRTNYDFANILCESVECLYKNLIKE